MEAYERLRPLGRGAFGVVHLGRCRQTRRLVVLKSIPMPEEDTKLALNEVQVLRLLSHPNIIEYVSSHVQEQSLVIVMEYAPGGTLRDYLLSLQQQTMEEEQVLHFFSQMLIAVQHIHGLNILHRDLKSENILLDRERQVIKIGDFGISKILATKTSASSVVGTPCYLSPELCEGRPYNRKSDVWALGCLLYEMATLRRTFEAATLAALVLKILRGSYAPLPAQLSAGLRQLVTALLSLDQTRRPSVMQAIAHPAVAPHACRLFSDIGMIPWHASTRPLSMSVSQTLASGRAGQLGAVWAARRPASPPPPPPLDDIVWMLMSELTLRQLTPLTGADRRLAAAARGSLSAVCVTGGGQAAVWWLADSGPPLTVERPAGVSFMQAASGGATVTLLTQRGIVLTFEASATGALTPPRIVQPLLGHEVTQLSCGPDHTLVRTSAGAVFAWGSNTDGQLGSGGRRPASSPQLLPLPAGVTATRVRAAAGCSLVITSDGRVLGCGLNAAGRLGSGDSGGRPGERRLRPTPLPTPEPVSDAVPCASRTALLTAAGALLWLGGQPGAPPVGTPLPAAVSALSGGSEPAVLALCSDGSLHAVSETSPRQPTRLELPGPGQPRLADGGLLLLSPRPVT